MKIGTVDWARPFASAWRVIAFTLFVCATGQAWAVKLGEGITAYYPFNGGATFSGYKWSDGALTADATLDFSCSDGEITSNGNNPKFGSSNYMLSGGGGSCKVYKVDADSAYPATSGNWSMSLWVKRNDSHGIPPLYCHSPASIVSGEPWSWSEPAAGENGGVYIYLESGSTGKIKVDFYVSSDGITFSKKTITSVSSFAWSDSLADWHSIILTRNGTTVSLFVDGTPEGAATIGAEDNLALPANSKLSLSKDWALGKENGAEDLCFWNRALTLGEVLAIAAGTRPISEIANSEVPLEVSGGYVTTAPQLAFKNMTLAEINENTLRGRFCGGYITHKGTEATFFNFSAVGSTLTCEAQMDGDTNDGTESGTELLKSVFLTFTQDGDDVYVSANATTKYMTKGDNPLGTSLSSQGNNGSLATSRSANGYGVYNLRLSDADGCADATVVWSAGEFWMPKTGSDGNKYTINLPSNFSIDANGRIASPTDATGSAGAGATIEISSPNTAASVLAKLTSAPVDSRGCTVMGAVYANGSTVNGSTATSPDVGLISWSASNTRLTAFYNINNNNSTKAWKYMCAAEDTSPISTISTTLPNGGYFLFGYDLENVRGYTSSTSISTLSGGTTVWGTANGIQCSVGNITCVSIGGATGKQSENSYSGPWNGMVIDKLALFVGSSKKNTDVASFEFPATKEANITAVGTYTLNGDNPLFASIDAGEGYLINVRESATLNINAATSLATIIFNVAEGKTLTLTGSTLTATDGIRIVGKGMVSTAVAAQLSGKIRGNGTIKYTGVVPPTGKGWKDSAWKGTLWIDNVGTSSTGWQFDEFGNSGSVLKLSRIQGHLDYSDGTVAPTVQLEDVSSTAALTVNNGSGGYKTTFNKLTGSGTLYIDNGSQKGNGLLIKDVRDFTGTINNRWSNRYTITIGGDTCTSGMNGKIIIATGATATIPNGKTWNAAGGFEINGTLAFNGTGTTTGSVTTSSGSTLDFTEATGSTHISGTLTVDSGTTIKFPAGATFPYQVATSVSGSISDSTPYYVGDTAYTGLAFSDGKAYPKTAKTITGNDSWNSAGWAPGYGGASDMGEAECTVNVTANATLNLGTASAGKVTFNLTTGVRLELNGTLAASEINFTGSGTVVCSAKDTLKGTIKGGANITIEYPEHILPTGAVWTDASAWQGTLILKNCGHLRNSEYESNANYQQHYRVPFEEYGNANSTIKAPGFKGYAAVIGTEVDAKICEAEFVIDAGDANQVEFNHGWTAQGYTHFYSEDQDAGFKFAKLSGEGHLKLDGDTDFAQYIFCDVSGFHGSVNITRPLGGGRKSFLFDVPTSWAVIGSEYPANLVIASSMTVAANKIWEVPAGIILRDNPTLTLSSGSTISHLSSASVGTLAVAENATATLQNVQDSVISTKLDIGSGATLNITDTAVTTLTIPADATGGTYVNNGTLNLSGCTSLTTLHLVLGSSKGFADLNTVKLVLPGTCKTIVYDVGTVRSLSGDYATDYSSQISAAGSGWLATPGNKFYYQATETLAEYSAKLESEAFTMTNVPNDANVKVKRYNGAIVDAEVSGTSRIYHKGSVFSGTACWHEWDFEQDTPAKTLDDSGEATAETPPADATAVTLVATTPSAADINYYNDASENKRYIPISEHPYPSTALTFGANWSAAVRCKMPSGANKVAIAFGDTESGILGLATGGRADVVELFNWTSENGGKYTTLAQLMVESAATAMHIYVLAVSEDSGTKYVTLYRDGELIHTAEFNLNVAESDITTFKIGDVIGTRTEGDKLPSTAIDTADPIETSGYVDYVRLYNETVDSSIAEGLSARRPFVSAIDLFERTVTTLTPESWSATAAWVKTAGTSGTKINANAPTPDGDPAVNVSVTMVNGSALELNIESDAAYGTLILNGSGEAAIRQNDDGRIGADMLVVRGGLDVTVDWSAVGRLSGPAFNVAGVDPGAKLTFDFTDYFTVNEVRTPTVITLIGNVPARAYDNSAEDRIEVLMPVTLPAYIQSAVGSLDDTTTPGVYTYKVTIIPDHDAGDNVYYKEGNFASDMTVYTDTTFTEATIPLTGDTVVVSDSSTANSAYISVTFDNNISVTRTSDAMTLTPVDSATVLGGKTITVADGCTLNLNGGTYGALTLNKVSTGVVSFTDDASVESLFGSATISVAAGKELALVSIPTYYSGAWHGSWITGGVTGTGTVKLPVINGNYGVKFNDFGTSGSTVAIADGTTAWFYQDTDSNVYIRPALRLDGSFVIQGLSSWAYRFEKIIGSGSISFPDSNEPASITIDEIADYSASTLQIVNNLSSEKEGVTITKISLSEDVAGGVRILRKTGKVTVSSVYVDDAESSMPLAYTSDGVYRAVAAYNDVNYPTIVAAITEATDENLTAITVLDEAATVPEGYYLSGAAGSKKVTLCAARSGELGSYIYYNDVSAIFGALAGQVKPVLTILDGNAAEYYSMFTGYVPGLAYDSEHSTLFVAVAAIGGDKYLSLTRAVQEAEDGQTIVLLSPSSEAITLNKAISLSGAALFRGALSGNGTITLDALPSSTIVASDWCGTVVLPGITGDLFVDWVGVSGSTIELTSMNGSFNKDSWPDNNFAIAPNIKISGPCTVNLEADGYTTLAYSFQTLSGTGTLTFTGSANQINIAKFTGYTGVLTYNNQSPAVTISAIDFATRPLSDARILSTSGTGNVTVINVTVNGVAPSPALRWVRRRNGSSGDGFYIQGGTIFSVY